MSRRNASLPSPECVVKVGDGRGFIIEYSFKMPKVMQARLSKLPGLRLRKFVERRVIITAAHCLPKLPPAHLGSHIEERTYAGLLGTLSKTKNGIWAECAFVDPVADIALLVSPCDQALSDEADAYDALVDDAPVVPIGRARSGPGWVLSLGGRWVRTKVKFYSGLFGTSVSIDSSEAGMSGSPILNDSGRAIGIIAIGGTCIGQPALMDILPGWLLQFLGRTVAQRTGH